MLSFNVCTVGLNWVRTTVNLSFPKIKNWHKQITISIRQKHLSYLQHGKSEKSQANFLFIFKNLQFCLYLEP